MAIHTQQSFSGFIASQPQLTYRDCQINGVWVRPDPKGDGRD